VRRRNEADEASRRRKAFRSLTISTGVTQPTSPPASASTSAAGFNTAPLSGSEWLCFLLWPLLVLGAEEARKVVVRKRFGARS
jgi:hypothetical protein